MLADGRDVFQLSGNTSNDIQHMYFQSVYGKDTLSGLLLGEGLLDES